MLDEAQQPAEALDRPDPGEGADGGSRCAVAQEELRLLDIGEVLGPGLERDVEDGGGELCAHSAPPRRGWRATGTWCAETCRCRRQKSAVAPGIADDERLGEVVVGQQLDGRVLGLYGWSCRSPA